MRWESLTYAWEERCLDDAEEEPDGNEVRETLDSGSGGGHGRPHDNAAGEVDGGPRPGQQHVGGELSQHVANVEDGNGNIELIPDQPEIGFEVVETRLTGGGSVSKTGLAEGSLSPMAYAMLFLSR